MRDETHVHDPVLRVTGLDKRFGSVQALATVDFALARGEIHALLGVNGAGKSTFIKVLSGVYAKDAGAIEIDGKPVSFRSPRDAIDNGIATVQQHPELATDLTGYESVFLGREGASPGFFRRLDRADLRRRGKLLLARFPVSIDLDRRIADLSAVEREIVAVLQALSRDNIKVLILDEPTSTLTEREKGILFDLMRTLRGLGIAIIYITHRLEEVMQIADRFTIFRGGRTVASMAAADAKARNLSLAELMLGAASENLFPPKAARGGPAQPAVLAVEGLTLSGVFDDVSFEARRGEILGVFGLVGSGLDELSKALFGATAPPSGTVRLNGKPLVITSPRQALRSGIFLMPGDRRHEGLALTESTIFNVTLANLGRASDVTGLLRRRANTRDCGDLATRVGLDPPLLSIPVSGFSGGNQQKIVIAKGLFAQADVYIFVEPTVGVDIGARAKLYGLMRALAEEAAVIVMSTDCDEVYGIADRFLALYKGAQVPLDGVETSRHALLMAGIMGEARA